ncbi:MAG: ABC transporter permease [Acidobacteriia bacterium]|nr:ABC transporter permease [Terriglobia bacterium]
MRTLLRNLVHSSRSLRKSPAFTIAAVATLALGIGANTAVFSVVDALVLRPLPYRDPARLVMVWDQLLKLGLDRYQTSFANYYAYRSRNQVLEDIAAFSFSDLNLEGQGGAVPERLEAMPVSANLFPVLGVRPILGQTFMREQNEAGRGNAVLLSYGLWRRRFAADPGIVGRTLRMNGQVYLVQGVMPPGFAFSIRTISTPDLWFPMAMPQSPSRQGPPIWLVARLKPGVSLEEARANLSTVAAGVEAADHPYTGPHGEDAGYHVTLEPLRDQLFGSYRTSVLVLAGAVVFVLLIVCANVANLLLARGARRQREIAVRAALGATRSQLLGELIAESLLLAFAGGVLGTLLAWWGIAILPALSPLPVETSLTLESRVLAFTVLLSLVTGLIFGLAPALRAVRSEFNLAGGRTVLAGGRNRFRSSLVAAEVALSVALLAGAGLLLKSFLHLQSIDPGFDPRNVLTVGVTLVSAQYRNATPQRQFFGRLIEAVRTIPGVESAGFVNILPLTGSGRSGDPFSIEGRPYDSSGRVPQFARRYRASPGYFQAMRIPLHSGRLLDERDTPDTERVAVINEALARGFWPQGDAIGQHIMMGAPRPGVPWLTIVGVVADIHNAGLRWEPIPQVYTAFAQDPTSAGAVVLRTRNDPMSVALSVRRAISAIDRGQAGFDIQTIQQRLAGSIQQDKFQTQLLGFFAIAALALASIGIYGVLEHSVSQRIPEIGLRMALGAGRADVLRMIVAEGMTPALLGLAAGLAGAFALTRFLESMLFGVAPHDPFTFAAIPLLFALVALAACVVPARQAIRVDPMAALRWE